MELYVQDVGAHIWISRVNLHKMRGKPGVDVKTPYINHPRRYVEVMNTIGTVRFVIILEHTDTIETVEICLKAHPPYDGVKLGPILDERPRIRGIWYVTLKMIENQPGDTTNWLIK